jgi:hypothetical protein
MSSNYAVLGLAMAAAGALTALYGARAIWIAAGTVYLLGSLVAFAMTRWLPVSQADELDAIETSSESAVAALAASDPVAAEPEPEPQPELQPEPERQPVTNGSHSSGLERIATLLEEIESRRELEARRSSS